MFGTYTPTGDGFGGADWEFIAQLIIFSICLYSVFRLIGKIFK